jgi:VWFA-related protein
MTATAEHCFVLRVLLLAAFLAIAATTLGLAAPDKSQKEALAELPEHWRVWLEEEVYPLISAEQKEAFLKLESEGQRRAFAERLWSVWGRETGWGSSFRSLYAERLALCRQEFKNTTDERSRALLLHGPPQIRLVSKCNHIFNNVEAWGWQYLEGLGEGVVVVFYQPFGVGAYRLWVPFDGKDALYTYTAYQELARSTSPFDHPAYRCFDGDRIVSMIAAAEMWARDPNLMRHMYHIEVRDRGPESTSARFMDFSALLPDDAEPLDFVVSGTPKGMRGGKVRMGLAVSVDAEGLGSTSVGTVDVVQLDVVGEISTPMAMIDRFRYLFSVPSADGQLGLRIERSVRPGEYSLRLKVEDSHSKKGSVTEIPFVVSPPTEEELAAMEAIATQNAAAAAAKKAARRVEDDEPEHRIILLVGPDGDAVSGLHRFEAVTFQPVARVSFVQDGETVLTKNSPPFDIDLDLGPLPKLTTVTAVAYDQAGLEIDRHELNLNVGKERFFVRLQPIAPPDSADGKVFVAASVNTPSDSTLERLELYWNDVVLATLYQRPFEAWVDLAFGTDFGYLRAVAYLEGGGQAEDIQFVNAPEFGSVVDVTSVELPVLVLDSSGKPVENLSAEDFTILEDGVSQEVTHCALHKDLPVRLGIVIDTSGSMEATLPDVQEVVMGFLRNLLRPRDRAFIETFADKPELLSSFSADLNTLENALLSLYADRDTAFYDGVIMGLFQFSGARGRRALVVITDGEDTVSKYDYDAVVDYATRAGVTIYTIGVDLPLSKVRIRHQLKRLAAVTGGTAFFLARDANLDRIYEVIDQELRTQYQLAYTSSSTRPAEEFREVEVEVSRKKVKVRTVAGYYPNSISR